ncbi:MAG: hypothetical protein AABX19_04115 [Nanoarchaeota archaeon]
MKYKATYDIEETSPYNISHFPSNYHDRRTERFFDADCIEDAQTLAEKTRLCIKDTFTRARLSSLEELK